MTPMSPDELKPIGDALAIAKSYVDLIVKPSLEQLGGILSDTVGLWRTRNQVRVLLKAKQYCEERGIKPQALMPDVFVPLIEEASYKEDPGLSDMFARLLTSQLDPQTRDSSHPAFAKVLGQMSGLDARVLKVLDEKFRENYEKRSTSMVDEWTLRKLSEGPFNDITPEALHLSLVNLDRLGVCFEHTSSKVKNASLTGYYGWRPRVFGFRLLAACSDPATFWYNAQKEFDELAAQEIYETYRGYSGTYEDLR